MVERNSKWEQLERDYPDFSSEWSGNTNSYFTTFTEFNSRGNHESNTRKSCGSDLIDSFIRMLVRELKLSPQEIRSWSLSDLTYMIADLLTKIDNEAYTMIRSSDKATKQLNTKRL